MTTTRGGELWRTALLKLNERYGTSSGWCRTREVATLSVLRRLEQRGLVCSWYVSPHVLWIITPAGRAELERTS